MKINHLDGHYPFVKHYGEKYIYIVHDLCVCFAISLNLFFSNMDPSFKIKEKKRERESVIIKPLMPGGNEKVTHT